MLCRVLFVAVVVIMLMKICSGFPWTSDKDATLNSKAELVRIVSLHTDRERLRRSAVMPDHLHFRFALKGRTVSIRVTRSTKDKPEVTNFPLFVIENGMITRRQLPSLQTAAVYTNDSQGHTLVARRLQDRAEFILEGVFYDGLEQYHVMPDPSGLHRVHTQDRVMDFGEDYIENSVGKPKTAPTTPTRRKRHNEFMDLRYDSDGVGSRRIRQAVARADKVTKQLMTIRRKRQSVAIYEIELFMVADFRDYSQWLGYYHGNKTKTELEMKLYYAFVANSISQRYRSISNVDPNLEIDILITGLLIVNSREDSYWTENYVLNTGSNFVEASDALESFRRWIRLVRSNLPDSDHWMLFTGYDVYTDKNPNIAGLAKLGGLCSYLSVSIIEQDNTGSVGATAAHELGHSLSARHDGEMKECRDEDNYIMSRKLKTPDAERHASRPWQFSLCSVRAFREFLSSVKCGQSGSQRGSALATELGGGQVFSADLQCRLALGKHSSFGRSLQHAESYTSMCRRLYCAVPGNPGLFQAIFAMEKTTCGDGKWCIQGKCTPDMQAPRVKDSCPQGDDPAAPCVKEDCRYYTTRTQDVYCCHTCQEPAHTHNFIFSLANVPAHIETHTQLAPDLPGFQIVTTSQPDPLTSLDPYVTSSTASTQLRVTSLHANGTAVLQPNSSAAPTHTPEGEAGTLTTVANVSNSTITTDVTTTGTATDSTSRPMMHHPDLPSDIGGSVTPKENTTQSAKTVSVYSTRNNRVGSTTTGQPPSATTTALRVGPNNINTSLKTAGTIIVSPQGGGKVDTKFGTESGQMSAAGFVEAGSTTASTSLARAVNGVSQIPSDVTENTTVVSTVPGNSAGKTIMLAPDQTTSVGDVTSSVATSVDSSKSRANSSSVTTVSPAASSQVISAAPDSVSSVASPGERTVGNTFITTVAADSVSLFTNDRTKPSLKSGITSAQTAITTVLPSYVTSEASPANTGGVLNVTTRTDLSVDPSGSRNAPDTGSPTESKTTLPPTAPKTKDTHVSAWTSTSPSESHLDHRARDTNTRSDSASAVTAMTAVTSQFVTADVSQFVTPGSPTTAEVVPATESSYVTNAAVAKLPPSSEQHTTHQTNAAVGATPYPLDTRSEPPGTKDTGKRVLPDPASMQSVDGRGSEIVLSSGSGQSLPSSGSSGQSPSIPQPAASAAESEKLPGPSHSQDAPIVQSASSVQADLSNTSGAGSEDRAAAGSGQDGEVVTSTAPTIGSTSPSIVPLMSSSTPMTSTTPTPPSSSSSQGMSTTTTRLATPTTTTERAVTTAKTTSTSEFIGQGRRDLARIPATTPAFVLDSKPLLLRILETSTRGTRRDSSAPVPSVGEDPQLQQRPHVLAWSALSRRAQNSTSNSPIRNEVSTRASRRLDSLVPATGTVAAQPTESVFPSVFSGTENSPVLDVNLLSNITDITAADNTGHHSPQHSRELGLSTSSESELGTTSLPTWNMFLRGSDILTRRPQNNLFHHRVLASPEDTTTAAPPSGREYGPRQCLALCRLFREPTLNSGDRFLDGMSRFFSSRLETMFDRIHHTGDLFQLTPTGDRVTQVEGTDSLIPRIFRPPSRRWRRGHGLH